MNQFIAKQPTVLLNFAHKGLFLGFAWSLITSSFQITVNGNNDALIDLVALIAHSYSM